MKKLISFSMMLAMLFVLTACPYSADFPLDAPNDKINTDYLGTWVEEGGFENPPFYVITKLSDKTYQFEKNEYNSSDKKYTQTKYTGHFTKMGTISFLNLKDANDNKYYFHKVELSPDKKQFTIYEVTDNIDEKFNSAAELRAFVDKYKDLSFFYNKDEKKYKKK
jgi:predicted small lipoprotein YifL